MTAFRCIGCGPWQQITLLIDGEDPAHQFTEWDKLYGEELKEFMRIVCLARLEKGHPLSKWVGLLPARVVEVHISLNSKLVHEARLSRSSRVKSSLVKSRSESLTFDLAVILGLADPRHMWRPNHQREVRARMDELPHDLGRRLWAAVGEGQAMGGAHSGGASKT